VRLLLDEHYSRQIVEQLRQRGHDVISVTERADLLGASDEELFAAMAREHRAIVTEDWADFSRHVEQAAADEAVHYGVIFTSRRQLPRANETIGLFVRVLDDFLRRNPAEDAVINAYRWLPGRASPE
jgi:DNA invertase Pin-like site-specific DNA recombinase